MDEIYYIVYKITNNINGKIYIGTHKTKNIYDSYMGSGKYLKYAQYKNGLENFTKEILFIYNNPTEMYVKEAELVNEDFIASENTYNMKEGGLSGWDFVNKNITYELRSIRASTSKWFLPKNHTDETKNKIRNGNIGKISRGFLGKNHTDETKNKMKLSCIGKQTGIKNSQYGTMWINNGITSKKIKKEDNIPDGWTRGRVSNIVD